MGALTGLLHLDRRPVPAALLDAMLGALAHRGSECIGHVEEGCVGLGARFDAMITSQRQAPPVAEAAAGRFKVVADARLDEREALAHRLGAREDAPDVVLIAEAFVRWGEETPRHLLGDFAFAVWDRQEQRLFCARDRMGVRALYTLHEPGRRFAFATEIHALEALPDFPRRLDEAYLADYLLLTLDHTSTFFRDVRRLPAATWMWVAASGPRDPVTYWEPDAETELTLASDEAYAEGFFEHFSRAVAERSRSVHPVGAALSGGLDSSSIAVVAREHRPAPLPVFSAQFAGLPPHLLALSDERSFVEAVVETGGFDLHVIEACERGPFTEFDRMNWYLEDHFRTINLYLHWGMFEAAQQAGVRVFLDGSDGDTVVSHGYDRFAELALRGDWPRFVEEARAFPDASAQRWFAWEYGAVPLAEALRRGDWRTALRGGWHLRGAFGFSARRLGRLYARSVLPSRERNERALAYADAYVRPDFAERVEAWPRYRDSQPHPAPTARLGHARGLRSPLFPHLLEMADRAAGAFGIEMRYPFFDTRLMEYCLSLPADQKLRGGQMRRVMRHALAGRLPDAVRLRTTKANLKPNFDLKLAEQAPRQIAPVLFGGSPAVAAYVDLEALRKGYEQFLTDPVRYGRIGTQVYTIGMLELGLRRLGLA